nr:MAG TPA: hypothetical protein [Caudoviricetes sp.]
MSEFPYKVRNLYPSTTKRLTRQNKSRLLGRQITIKDFNLSAGVLFLILLNWFSNN